MRWRTYLHLCLCLLPLRRPPHRDSPPWHRAEPYPLYRYRWCLPVRPPTHHAVPSRQRPRPPPPPQALVDACDSRRDSTRRVELQRATGPAANGTPASSSRVSASGRLLTPAPTLGAARGLWRGRRQPLAIHLDEKPRSGQRPSSTCCRRSLLVCPSRQSSRLILMFIQTKLRNSHEPRVHVWRDLHQAVGPAPRPSIAPCSTSHCCCRPRCC